ncbi:hypothetical protein BKI52_23750 [marine bacterium AO1-C]|nr:hypothetical protein BKI52_23750 [marine bacterium AO1-C]
MKRVIILCCACFLGYFNTSIGCENAYTVNLRGQYHAMYLGLPVFYRAFDLEFSRDYLRRFDLSQRENISYQHLSDAAVHLTRLGKYAKALDLLQWLNKKYPNKYKIVANLGTLYEINGQLDSAYYYIQKGMQLNAKSHYGSEWVHLSILKAKKAYQADPSWVLYNNVLNMTHLRDTIAEKDRDKLNIALTRIQHMVYQMEERIPFSKTPDVIVANVMREVGDLLALHASIGDAHLAYQIAQYYDPKDQLRLKNRLAKLKPLLKKYGAPLPSLAEHFPDEKHFFKLDRQSLPAVTTMQKVQKILEANVGVILFFLILAGIAGVYFLFFRNRNKAKIEKL